MTMEHFKIHCDIATSSNIISRAIKVSLIVGSALNLINQGDAILSLNPENINILKILLTYAVPYSVTTYTATAMKLEFQLGTKSIIETDLVCQGCKTEMHIKEDELIPECLKCGIHTKWRLK